jgi:ABC-type Fe3+-siderophore transport system permease subunit
MLGFALLTPTYVGLALLVDDFTRTALCSEVPIGLVGTPFLVFLLWKKKTRGWTNED